METVDHLRKWIDDGRLRPGTALPSERALGERFNTHRTTIRRALVHLGEAGLLRRDGRRTVVAQAAGGWMSKAAVVLLPPVDEKHLPAIARAWVEYATLYTNRALLDAGLHALNLNVSELDEAALKRLAADRPMGVLVPEVFSPTGSSLLVLAETLVGHGLRVVVSGGNPMLDRFDRVVSDHEAGGHALTRGLIDRGCRRIVPFWHAPHDRYWLLGRRAGYERAMREAGLEPLGTWEMPALPPPPLDAARFASAAKATAGHLLAEAGPGLGVDALMVASDRDSFVASAACRLFGRVPGRDVLVAGYDNVYQNCEERQFEPSGPALTVDKHNEAMGREMIRLLADRAAGRLPDGPAVRVVTPELVVPAEVKGVGPTTLTP